MDAILFLVLGTVLHSSLTEAHYKTPGYPTDWWNPLRYETRLSIKVELDRRTLSMDNAGATTSGQTTRYWDCCKPSCAWNGKGPSTPVTTCQADGTSPIDVNAQSGCNGGPAFVCNNQQPFAVNDNLAYGFAAASIQGQTEQDWCCKCYKLDFTSGPVAGKTMIVQVTNSGGDLGVNHFDLQLPGGGWGIFDGCSPQWHLPESSWGNRYGGITNRDACNGLPEPLRPGCFFRFDWFQNADNPSMEMSETGCPGELTSITGCSR